jgi:hypothetical protein
MFRLNALSDAHLQWEQPVRLSPSLPHTIFMPIIAFDGDHARQLCVLYHQLQQGIEDSCYDA